ncbi:MAG TPA: alpha/beta hydrolase [Actinophytocola sp.]|uniref:alpha/beta hydrolase n=1 Tax=Actinophytocola sp. TaxID=1872138 RepID=UPI002DBC1026|nr:lysophospholipase [Actinophytocola sp.]HEU5475349.1 alpha/beta hydrolase [Actinophytocola sp.]
MTTEHVEGRFAGAAGGQIYWQGWVPAGEVTAVVVIVHGLAEHGGRYAHVGNRLAADGYAVYAADHRGHGKSEGTRGNINRMAQVVVDLETMIRSAAQRHPDKAVFLYGHSMGGLVALVYATTGRPAELRGMILTSSAVDIAVGPKVARLAGRGLSAVAPNLGTIRLDASTVSRDPEVVRAYDADPLNYRGKIRARTGAEMLAAAEAVRSRLATLTMPLLLLHGSADRLTAPSGTKLVADRAGSTDITHKLYDGWYHELHNEPDKDSVFDDIVVWLKEHG